jgi:hypothetical protein
MTHTKKTLRFQYPNGVMRKGIYVGRHVYTERILCPFVILNFSGLCTLSRVKIIKTPRFRDRRCPRPWAKIKLKIYSIVPDKEAILNNLATCAN